MKMNKKQAENCLTLADLLKKKYEAWNFAECEHCAMHIANENSELFGEEGGFVNDKWDVFGERVNDLFCGADVLSTTPCRKTTQKLFRKVLLDVVDQEGWEEA